MHPQDLLRTPSQQKGEAKRRVGLLCGACSAAMIKIAGVPALDRVQRLPSARALASAPCIHGSTKPLSAGSVDEDTKAAARSDGLAAIPRP